MSEAPFDRFYVLGGTMEPGSPSYVVRQADSDLYQALLAGDLCYVLASRQMGKSSLMARTAELLTGEGFRCATIDITIFSEKRGEPDDWYYALVDHIADKLGIAVDVQSWWQANQMLSPLRRMTKFLENAVLENCRDRIVIFVDEIDSTISLPFSDDFFAAIRACQNARATDARFRRLSFVLLGVATPAQLIRDHSRTPFNVGRPIQLTDFTRDEALPLAVGLSENADRAAGLLNSVLDWTSGHPYLTQTLCWYLVKNKTWEVDELVERVFLSKQALREEPNLQLVRSRLTQGVSDVSTVLKIYQRIVRGEPVRDEPSSSDHASLKLSGVVKTDEAGELKIRNRIYERVFSEQWVRLEMPVEAESARDLSNDIKDAYLTYDALRKLPGFRNRAIHYLANFWESRRARDQAILTRIKALREESPLAERRWLAGLIDVDYPSLIASCVHEGAVLDAVFSPDGTRILTGSEDGTARLWSVTSGESMLPPLRHRTRIRTVAFSPDGQLLATGSDDFTACLWGARTGNRAGVPFEHQARIRAVIFHPAGDRVLTTSADGTAVLWTIANGERAIPPLEHTASVVTAAFSPDGELIATVSQDKSATLWQTLTGKQVAVLEHSDHVTGLAFHPKGKWILTACEDGIVRIWSVKTGLPGAPRLIHNRAVLALAISLDGKLVLTGCADATARLWNFASGEEVGRPMWHRDSVLAVALTADGQRILTGSADRTARVWSADGSALTPSYQHRGRVTFVAFSPDGSKILTSGEDEAARLWAVEGASVSSLPRGARLQAEVASTSLSADGSAIAAAGTDDGVVVWSTSGGELTAAAAQNLGPAVAIALSPDGSRILTGRKDGSVYLFDAQTGQHRKLYDHQASVLAVAFSPDGTRVVTGGYDNAARTLTLGTPESAHPHMEVLPHRGWVRCVKFSSDGQSIFTGSHDRAVRRWSLNGNLELELRHFSSIQALACNATNTAVLAATSSRTVLYWRTPSIGSATPPGSAPYCTLPGPSVRFTMECQDAVLEVGFTPEDDRFIVATENWIYLYGVEDDGPVLLSARLLGARWMNAYRWCDSNCIEAVLLDTGDAITTRRICLLDPELEPVTGKPKDLLSEWQHRLGMRIDESARVRPTFYGT